MIYQLSAFDNWIRTEIYPEKILLTSSDHLVKEYLQFAEYEKERICGYFRKKAINNEPPLLTTKFIQVHQVGINTIIDIIVSYTKKPLFILLPEQEAFYIRLCQIIEEITHFIKQHLPEYFDADLPITYTNAEWSRAHLHKQLQSLQPLYQSIALDKALLSIAIRPFKLLIEENKRISHRELAYLQELARGLQGLLDFTESTDITYELHLILFQLNFNFPRYVLHYCYWLDAKILDIPDRTQRFDKLAWYIHAIEQIRFKPNFVLVPELPSLKEQLLTSIKTTHQYLLMEDKPVHQMVAEQTSDSNKPERIKIRLSVSVPVLALFLKLLIKSGIIINENKAEVFREMAENFTSLKSGSISYHSLKAKYNKTPSLAYLQLKDILIKILDSLKQA